MPSPYQSPPPSYDPIDISPVAILSCTVAGLVLIYHLLTDILRLPPLWEVIFIMIPGALLGPSVKEQLQYTFGGTPGGMVARVRQRAASLVGGGTLSSGEGVVGGLWNVGNTCYQNSVLQAMASLSHLKPHLAAMTADDTTASGALSELLAGLNQLSANSRTVTPAAVIVKGSETSGWTYNEQQDAQEFFQNLTGSLEKDVARVLDRRRGERIVGLEGLVQKQIETDGANENQRSPTPPVLDKALKSPFEGLLAQRVGCLKCGYVESISLQPFTTLSLSLPSTFSTTIEDCLAAFTDIERIPQVDCDKCTLLAVHSRLASMLTPDTPEKIRSTIETRLKAVEEALEDDNFTPSIPGLKLDGAHKVSSTKTKHIMIARPPPVLVIHTNRSQFDMLTGIVGKNYAMVEYPAILDLAEVGAVTSHEELCPDPARPISGRIGRSGDEVLYKLRAVVAHYGAHHNGHYVCYRETGGRWFRISDHVVDPCTEQEATRVGNAFMIFYERINERPKSHTPLPPSSPAYMPVSTPAWFTPLETALPPLPPMPALNLPILLDGGAAEIPLPSSPSLSPALSATPDDVELPVEELPELAGEDDVPELTNDVSSERDTSPETPPPDSPSLEAQEFVGMAKKSGSDTGAVGRGNGKKRRRGKRRNNRPSPPSSPATVQQMVEVS